MDARPEQIYPVYDFWHTSPNFFLIRVGLLLAILSATYAWCRWGAGQWGFSPLIQLGQTSLLVYWVHIEFVYGRLSIVPKHAVGIRTASFGLLAIFLAMLALSLWRTRWKAQRGGSCTRWKHGRPRPSACGKLCADCGDGPRTSVGARAYIAQAWRMAFSVSFSAIAQR